MGFKKKKKKNDPKNKLHHPNYLTCDLNVIMAGNDIKEKKLYYYHNVIVNHKDVEVLQVSLRSRIISCNAVNQ